MNAKIMEIPDPVANYGDTVYVHNYRSKPKDGSKVWEEGTITDLAYRNNGGRKWRWKYEVELTRRSRAGRIVRIPAGHDDIDPNY